MWRFFSAPSSRTSPWFLVMITVGAALFLFVLLELWRPCYFLTDDNLSGGLPILTEMGRNMGHGHLPFTSDYLFGGHYNYLRDMDTMQWHPFTMLPALLANTPARFWIIDVEALMLLMMTTVGFTLLACRLREEFAINIPNVYLVFYTLSFIFSTFVLTVGPSWLNFVGNLSSLPWLALGLLDRKVARATFLICFVTMHEILIGYPAFTFSSTLFMTLFAIGIARSRHSGDAFFVWFAGNTLAIAFLLPLLLTVLEGFAHSYRVAGLPPGMMSEHSIPADLFVFSFFMGNWMEPVTQWLGDKSLATLAFPYLPSIMACAAAWCVIPAWLSRARWRPLEKVCLVLLVLLFLWIIRPDWMAKTMAILPFFRSMRWPFREGLLFLFFFHLLLIMRFPERLPRAQAMAAVVGLLIFFLPLPFVRVPTMNALALDRHLLFSGQAERFWAGVKTQLKPTDSIATAIDLDFFRSNVRDIPYTLLGTADFPAFFQVRTISGYSPTAPTDQIPMKIVPDYWFGAFLETQVPDLLKEKPGVRLLRIKKTHPLEITMTNETGQEVDLAPYLKAAGITEAPAAH